MTYLNPEDYIIFAVTLIFCLGIGLYFSLRNTKQKTTKQFILGDENMSFLPVALSMMVSFESGIMMLGVPAEVYMYGLQWYISCIATFFSQLLTQYLFIPALRKLKITSVNQYIELRYNSHSLRLFATITSLLARLNYLGTVVFVPAVTLELVIGVPMWISIVSLMACVLLYTIIGGFKAVIWTDVFQSVLMYGGLLAIIIKGTVAAGGVTNTWRILKEKGRVNLIDFNPDPTLRQSFWSLVAWGLANGFRIQFFQATYQRIRATPSITAAKRMYITSAILSLSVASLAALNGAVMFAYYHSKGCDPIKAKLVKNANQLIAVMVRDIFLDTPCLPGLFLAALFSASLSTMSSILSAMSAMIWEDIIKPHTKPMSDKQAIRITKISVLLSGGLAILLAFGISGLEGPISRIIDITGSCLHGATGGLFLLGWLIPNANALGALAGGMVCVVFVGWVSFGKLISTGVRVSGKLEPAATENCPVFNISRLTNVTLYEQFSAGTQLNDTSVSLLTSTSTHSGPEGLDVLYSLSYKWLMPVGFCLVLVAGSLISRLKARKPVDQSLIIPVCEYLCYGIPDTCKRKCRVKYPDSEKDRVENRVTTESNAEMLLFENRF